MPVTSAACMQLLLIALSRYVFMHAAVCACVPAQAAFVCVNLLYAGDGILYILVVYYNW